MRLTRTDRGLVDGRWFSTTLPPMLDFIGFEVRGNAFRAAVAALGGVRMRSTEAP